MNTIEQKQNRHQSIDVIDNEKLLNNKIRQFRAIIPIDLVVYAKQMYHKLLESRSIFTEEINRKGKVVYETI